MMKKALFAVAISGAMATAQADVLDVLIDEGFDDVSTLEGKGWIRNNASNPAGPLGWFQGDQSQFESQAGAPESYAAVNFSSGDEGGTLANWLITPEFSTVMNTSISFWLRGAEDATFFDQVAFGFSTGGSALSDFVLSQAITVQTGEWTKFEFRLEPTPGTARFAIQYTGLYANANYLGVDSLRIEEVPEPASILILAAGALGLAATRRRKRA